MSSDASPRVQSFFSNVEPPATGERFDVLLRHRNLVIERIVSSAQITPEVYVQEQDEWVILMEGEAEIWVEGEVHTLQKGDYLFLPAQTPHEVRRTSADALWLAVHLHPEAATLAKE